jgi:hypothetical protein
MQHSVHPNILIFSFSASPRLCVSALNSFSEGCVTLKPSPFFFLFLLSMSSVVVFLFPFFLRVFVLNSFSETLLIGCYDRNTH